MFQASVNQEAYDADRWGQFYKPFGLNTGNSADRDEDGFQRNTGASSAPSAGASDILSRLSAKASAPAVEEDEAPAAPAAAATGGKPDAQEILRRIRERQGN
ncbi:hypothetical protein D3C71_1466180 [compost metagenome]